MIALPPTDIWLPAKPAIIRPAPEDFGFPALGMLAGYAPTGMQGGKKPVEFVGSTSSTSTSVAVPSHVAGDLIVIAALRANAATAPSLASGYTSILVRGATDVALRLASRIATNSSTTSGTWTNANVGVICFVFRNAVTGASNSNAGSAPTPGFFNYPAMTLENSSGSSFVMAFILANGVTNNSPPTATTEKQTVDAGRGRGFSTDTGVSSWGLSNRTNTNSLPWVTAVLEAKVP